MVKFFVNCCVTTIVDDEIFIEEIVIHTKDDLVSGSSGWVTLTTCCFRD